MSIIKLSSGYQMIPEGTYTFKIEAVSYDENFGKLDVTLKTENGLTHHEKYNLLNDQGEVVEGAIISFTYLAKAALNNPDLTQVDPNDLVGHFFAATVEHEPYESKKTGKTGVAVRLNDKTASDGWESSQEAVESSSFDLDAFLNG